MQKNLKNKDNIEIKKVEKSTELYDKTINFIKNCSWDDVKEHLTWMLENWVFEDYEAIFVVIINNEIVGITTIMKTDYYPLKEIEPWISSIFVSEDYRGQRISEALINYANDYAKSLGFKETYIPSEFFGLYEKYGYEYLKNITNYGGGVDHLFRKKIKE